MSRSVKCHSSKHVFCVVCHWAKWSLGLMSRCREHKHSNWEVRWVTGMSTQAKKQRAGGLMKPRSVGHVSAAREQKYYCMREKKQGHNGTHSLSNEARVIQLNTSKRWTGGFFCWISILRHIRPKKHFNRENHRCDRAVTPLRWLRGEFHSSAFSDCGPKM